MVLPHKQTTKMGVSHKPAQHTIGALEKSCLFDKISKAVLFDIFIDNLVLQMGEAAVLEDDGFLIRLQEAVKNGAAGISVEGFDAQIKGAIALHKSALKYKNK